MIDFNNYNAVLWASFSGLEIILISAFRKMLPVITLKTVGFFDLILGFIYILL